MTNAPSLYRRTLPDGRLLTVEPYPRHWTGTRAQLGIIAKTKISFQDGKVVRGTTTEYYPVHLHAGFEHGSGHVAPNPCLRRALFLNYHYALRLVAQAMRSRLESGKF